MSNLTPHLKSPTPFAVILCGFNDLPPLSIPNSVFEDFIAGPGKGGVYDYWKDISFGTIDLSGSQIFGPFTMQYSFFKEGNLVLPGYGKPRNTWVNEAIRLAKENAVPLSQFYGVIAVVNSNPDDSHDGGRNLALGIKEWGQKNWRWCCKCEGLAYAGNPSPGVCPAGGVHDLTKSSDYTLAMNMLEVSGQNNWKWCNKCQGLAFAGNLTPGACPAGGIHDLTISADYTLQYGEVNFPGQDNWMWCNKCQELTYAGNPTLGVCPGGGMHNHAGSGNYTLSAPIFYDSHLNVSFAAHEIGHCFDLQHAHCADVNPPADNWDYCDQWDLMGPGTGVYYDSISKYSPVGPGLNAGNISRLGCIPKDRIYTQEGSPATIQLAALSHPSAAGFLMARIITSDRIYTVEYRQRDGWDMGLASDAIVIHELRTPYTLGQNNWRWCSKCMGLAYGRFGSGACPEGGGHNLTMSWDYSLIPGLEGFEGQNNWKWCAKCQGLVFIGNGLARCPAGGMHDLSHSLDYTLINGATAFAGQNNWQWCSKCQGLAFAGLSSPGKCPAGGMHEHSGSGDYTLLHFSTAEPFLIGSWQAGQSWVNFEKGLSVEIQRIDPSIFTATVRL